MPVTAPPADPPEADERSARRPLLWLTILATLLWALHAAVAWLSPAFAYSAPVHERPIWPLFGVFTAAFLVYLACLRCALRVRPGRHLIGVIWLFALSLRAVLLLTEPILEIDIYRYIWDGRVVAAGVNPYRHSPLEVVTTESPRDVEPSLRRLVELRDRSQALRSITARIHFAELASPYPPVSQAVFAAAAVTTPDDAGIGVHLVVMKAWLLLFDLATAAGVLGILRLSGMHPGWAIAYAWCPLVTKEFANSGHLDAIAVCCTTFAVYAALRMKGRPVESNSKTPWWAAAFVLLALGVGTKLYPVVLAPLLAVWTLKHSGGRAALLSLALFVLLSAAVLLPMVGAQRASSDHRPPAVVVHDGAAPPLPTDTDAADHPLPPAPRAERQAETDQTASGLVAFLTQWRMNDFLFHLLEANVQPDAVDGPDRSPWFAVTPDTWRTAVCDALAQRLGASHEAAAFLTARTLTAAVFAGLMLLWAWRLMQHPDERRLGECAFLTLAWFWLLAPTQNPWYWTWALPLLPFARNRAWLALSGLVMIYYLRFWCEATWLAGPAPLGTADGADFFDQVMTWIEYGPWFVWLAAEWSVRRDHGKRPNG